MIIKGLFELVYILLTIIFLPINLPDLPSRIQSVLNQLQYVLVDALGLFSVFVNFYTVKTLLPVVLVIANLDKAWGLIMFVLRKIPFLGIK